jgi:hypothetical protein
VSRKRGTGEGERRDDAGKGKEKIYEKSLERMLGPIIAFT